MYLPLVHKVHITFTLNNFVEHLNSLHFTFAYLSLCYNFPKFMCNVAHLRFLYPARFLTMGEKHHDNGHQRTDPTLRSGAQEKYGVLPAGKWLGRIHEQNPPNYPQKDSQ